MTARMPARTRLWSSTSMTRIGRCSGGMRFLEGEMDDDLRPFRRLRMDLQRPVQQGGPLPHPKEPEAGSPRLGRSWQPARIEPHPVVAHREPDTCAVMGLEPNIDVGRPRVLHGV